MSKARRGLFVSLTGSPLHACVLLAALTGCSTFAADSPAAPQAEAIASPAVRMTWADLRDTNLPDVAAFARLWNDKLASAQGRWRSPGQLGATSGKPLQIGRAHV